MHYLDIFDVIDLQEEEILASVSIAIQPGTVKHYCWYLRNEKKFSLLAEIGSMSVNEARTFERGGRLMELVRERFEALDPERIKFARVHADMWNDSAKMAPEVSATTWLQCQDVDFLDSDQNE